MPILQGFTVHKRLEKDSVLLRDLPLCQLRMINDARFPWFLLVPRTPGVCEVHHLPEKVQQQLWRESALLANAMERAFAPDKLNVAAIGNLVPQLHVHHVARYRDDAEWPAPIWGRGEPVLMETGQQRERSEALLHFMPAED